MGRSRTHYGTSFPHHRISAGYTLIEMMVVVLIIAAVSTIVIVSQGSFTKGALLANATYDIGLSIRTAQNYGISSRSLRVGTQFLSNTGYGIEFKNLTSFDLFADTDPAVPDGSTPNVQPGNKYYDPLSGDIKIQTLTLNNSITISNFCSMYYAPATHSYCKSCTGIGNCSVVSVLDIVFSRPNTDATFTVLDSGGGPVTTGSPLTKGCIKISTPLANSIPRYLAVTQLGQVAATSSCP